MSVLPKVIYSFNAIPINIPIIIVFFTKIEKSILKIHLEFQGTLNRQSNLEKKRAKLEVLYFSDFKTYYKAQLLKWCATGIEIDI